MIHPCRQQFVNRRGKIVSLRFFANEAHLSLVIDSPLVANDSLLIKQEDFGGTAGSKSVGDLPLGIFQKGIGDLLLFNEGTHLFNAVLDVGVDRHDAKAGAGILARDLLQPSRVEIGHQRAFAPQEGDYNQRSVEIP